MVWARAGWLPPAGWSTAATNSCHDGAPNLFVSYALFNHWVRTSLRQLWTSRQSVSMLSRVPGWSLRARPRPFHLAATLQSSEWTSNRSLMSAERQRIENMSCLDDNANVYKKPQWGNKGIHKTYTQSPKPKTLRHLIHTSKLMGPKYYPGK